jgi:hypothetical protein
MWVGIDGRPVADAAVTVPGGWECRPLGDGRFELCSGNDVGDRNIVSVTVPGVGTAGFTVLGPNEARGFPAGDNVAKCPRCQARVEACICGANT